MKKIVILIFLLTTVLAGKSQSKLLRIITYNIMDGFNFGKDSVRQMKTAKWLRSQHPDVVALQELCGYTSGRLEKEAAQWGHPYSVLLKTTGYSVGITSKEPITIIEKKTAGMWHGMLHCKAYGIDILVVHLSPDDYQYRSNEADTILFRVNKILQSNGNCIVLGDFNAKSPFDDDINGSRPVLLERDRIDDAKSIKYKNLANSYFDYSVIGKFLALPLIDVTQSFVPAAERFSYGAPILIPRYRKTMEEVISRQHRLDYIFVNPQLARHCVSSTIANGQETQYLSDHYPVTADFIISNRPHE